MAYTLDYLKANSNLPGPRANLELLYGFAAESDDKTVDACLKCILPDTANSPEEFVGMCGILGYAVRHRESNKETIDFLRKYASHASWRIREAVAMGIQEISAGGVAETLANLGPMIDGNFLEQRAVVAGLCEPKLLRDKEAHGKILGIMERITKQFDHGDRLTNEEDSLRKALGYGWSVIVAAASGDGKKTFEKLFDLPGKHVKWIIRENLKKNRLIKMDGEWVSKLGERLQTAN